jgi:hypothetical protein
MALIANSKRDMLSIPIGHRSKGGIVSEIQSLKSAIEALGQSISLWNGLMIWGFSLAAFFTVCGIAATKIVVHKTEEQSIKQGLLNVAEDRQLKSDLRDKDLKIEEAQRSTGEVSNQLEQERQKTSRLRIEAAAAVTNLNQRFVQANRPRRIAMGSRGDGKTDDRDERQKRFKALEAFAGTEAIIQSVSDEEPKTLARDMTMAGNQ